MSTMHRKLATVAALGLAFGLSACAGHVSQEELNPQLDSLRTQIEDNDQRIADNASAIENLQTTQDELRGALDQLRSDFDARINELEDRLVLTLPIHFEFDRAEIRSVDEPLLNRFAAEIRNHMSQGVVTVEGFADQAGSSAYNQQLSQDRAQAVKEFLVNQGNLSEERVRAVGYGENRLINEQTGPGRSGIENRRVTFVVEFSGEVGS